VDRYAPFLVVISRMALVPGPGATDNAGGGISGTSLYFTTHGFAFSFEYRVTHRNNDRARFHYHPPPRRALLSDMRRSGNGTTMVPPRRGKPLHWV